MFTLDKQTYLSPLTLLLRQIYEQMSSGLLKQLCGPNRWLSLDLAGHLALLGNRYVPGTYNEYG